MFAAFSVVVPVPAWVNPPEPVIAAELKSVPCVTALLRFIASVPLSTIALPAASEPVVPSLPSWRIPDVIVVAPV